MVAGYSEDTGNVEELIKQIKTLSIFCQAGYSLSALPHPRRNN